MNEFHAFLNTRGARWTEGDFPEVADFGAAVARDRLAAGFVAPLSDRRLIAAAGDDAATFLHAQLTNDVLHLQPGAARLAGYCTPKGRLQATLLTWRDGDAIWLQAAADVAQALQKRLQMFILRAKVKLTAGADHPARAVTLGLGGAGAGAALAPWFPQPPAAPYATVDNEHGLLIRVADAFDAPRYQWLTSEATATQAWPQLTATLAAAGNAAWRLAEILAGVPQVTLATQDQFVPQMVNFELLGGVNFKKGCYPGQEIVARSQYLGKLKRRTVLARVAAAAPPGTELYASTDPEQPCGMIVNAAPDGDATACLAEVKLAALEGATIHLGAAGGPPLAVLPLPYALDPLDV
jgi:folate-binding protein YgfZ